MSSNDGASDGRRRASTFSMTGSRRLAFAATAFSSRSMNSGRISLPMISIDSMMPSWARGLSSRMISSTPLAS